MSYINFSINKQLPRFLFPRQFNIFYCGIFRYRRAGSKHRALFKQAAMNLIKIVAVSLQSIIHQVCMYYSNETEGGARAAGRLGRDTQPDLGARGG